ncbi:hypothetical protein V6N11_016841 [Hibiscus sabdariffa]|uniref:Homeobox domain-containing protein n=1 Tax=Hibiscus sabdariffa TaxID=183260 RepID=A0ABR2TWR5_9ROSI
MPGSHCWTGGTAIINGPILRIFSKGVVLQEEEKLKLSEITGLGQKQINNWFINQRKRHWKPSDDMKFALLDGAAGSIRGGPAYLDAGVGTPSDAI